MLHTGFRAAIYLARWFAFEVLPLSIGTNPNRGVGVLCRLVGCGVALGVLSVELHASAASHGKGLALLWAASAFTALLIGNVAREWMFSLCSTFITMTGHIFYREGVTLDGRTFLEVHYSTMIWLRCESAADKLSYEWTEPTGRCNRIEIQFHSANSGPDAGTLQPVVREFAAPPPRTG